MLTPSHGDDIVRVEFGVRWNAYLCVRRGLAYWNLDSVHRAVLSLVAGIYLPALVLRFAVTLHILDLRLVQ